MKIVGTPRTLTDLGRLLALARRSAAEEGRPDARRPPLARPRDPGHGAAGRGVADPRGAARGALHLRRPRRGPGGRARGSFPPRRWPRATGCGDRARPRGSTASSGSTSSAASPPRSTTGPSPSGGSTRSTYLSRRTPSRPSWRPGRTSTSPASASRVPGRPTSSPHLAPDCVEPAAARAASVNTVVVQDGQMHGSSTDGDGVLAPLRHHLVVSERPVTIVGAGGAARAAGLRPGRGRRPGAGSRPARGAGGGGGGRRGLRARVPRRPRRRSVGRADQRHPGGLGAQPGREPGAGVVAALGRGGLRHGLRAPRDPAPRARPGRPGCRTIDGVEMLVAQAVGQFETWTGVPAPVEAMTEAALAAIAEARP